VKFLCEQCKAKYQIADDKVVGKTVRMKCRKCGHLIEVRAAVTETSVSSVPPGAPGGSSPSAPPSKTAATKSTSIAASLAATRSPASRSERPGVLAGTFKTSVQHEDEVSAPFDMAEIAPGDDWYVAIHGVPVGPIRVAEIRRKAALGAVTEDSLVWQEGLDEWRPLRAFPDLAAMVRDAATTGRTSVTPPPAEARPSFAPPQRGATRPATAPGGGVSVSRSPQQRPPAAGGPMATRSNVVPITSRLATAERLEEPTQVALRPAALVTPAPAPAAASTPLPTAEGPLAGSSVAAEAATATTSTAPKQEPKGGPPWLALGMVAMCTSFGLASAWFLLGPRSQSPQSPGVQGGPSSPVAHEPTALAGSATALNGGPGAAANDTPLGVTPTAPPLSTARGAAGPGGTAHASGAIGTSAASSSARVLDLKSFAGNAPVIPPTEGSDVLPSAAGQCITGGQLQTVIDQHRVALRRTCWERAGSAKLSANVNVAMTIGGDGNAQEVSASGDDPAVAHCIENDVRNWHFPNLGCSQKIAVPFKFVRQ
jgi:predicted Zn finger-like uncharacterized protein